MKESEFSVVPLEVVQDRRLTLEQTRVLIALFSFRNKATNTVWPSRAAIAERTGVAENRLVFGDGGGEEAAPATPSGTMRYSADACNALSAVHASPSRRRSMRRPSWNTSATPGGCGA